MYGGALLSKKLNSSISFTIAQSSESFVFNCDKNCKSLKNVLAVFMKKTLGF
jgi:hypothetical protein